VVEYPEADHPVREAARAGKRALHARLAEAADALGARAPDRLADAMLLLVEGAFACGQIFGPDGPTRSLAAAAEALIAASRA
jgi:hypothetical protein